MGLIPQTLTNKELTAALLSRAKRPRDLGQGNQVSSKATVGSPATGRALGRRGASETEQEESETHCCAGEEGRPHTGQKAAKKQRKGALNKPEKPKSH